MNYTNNSVILITEIGTDSTKTSGEALQCITELTPCCRQDGANQMLMGQWHYPSGTEVPGNEGDDVFFRTRGLNDGTVNLFRRNAEVMSPVGLYCCEIPDADEINRVLCIDIGE